MIKKLKSYKRRNFSLLEVMVALAILLMISSFVAVKGYGLVKSYRFENALQRIKQEIALTHQVATSYQIDVDFVIQQSEGGIECIRTTDERLKHLIPFFKKGLVFKDIKVTDSFKLPMTIHFYGSGWVEPRKGFHITNRERVSFINIDHLLSPLMTKS